MPHLASPIRNKGWWLFTILVAFFAGVLGAVAPSFASRYCLSLPAVAGIYACFVLLLVLVIAPGIAQVRLYIETNVLVRTKSLTLLFLCSLPYFIYAAGAGDFRWTALLRLLAIPGLLLLLYGVIPVRDPSRFSWQDFIVALWLIAAVLSHQVAGIWNVPIHLDFMARLYLIAVASWTWTFIRPVPQLHYDFFVSRKTFRAAARNFLWFALIAIPSSLALHFTAWNPRWPGPIAFSLNYLEIFLFIALLEELFFRGFLQTLLSKTLASAQRGQILAACLFGLFHILHAPFPNWRYVLLATVAGWFYGSAFRQGGTLMASSLTHALVDTVWRTFLSKS